MLQLGAVGVTLCYGKMESQNLPKVVYYILRQCLVCFCCACGLSGGRYVVQEGGLQILNATDSDAGNYTCRAEVDEIGNYAERFISVAVNSAFFFVCCCRNFLAIFAA